VWTILGIFGLLSLIVAVTGTAVLAFKRSPAWKKWLSGAGIAFLLFVAGAVMSSLPNESPADNQAVEKTNSAHQEQKENVPAGERESEKVASEQKNTQQVKEEQSAPVRLQQAYVSCVIDGDTIVVNLAGAKEKVRLIGVDTPESTTRHEPYGEEASEFTKSKLAGRKVYLEKDVSERDKYGRLLRYIWLEPPSQINEREIRSKMFNAVLVLEGYAQVATYLPDVKYTGYFVKFQREAREAGRGLWGISAVPASDNPSAVSLELRSFYNLF